MRMEDVKPEVNAMNESDILDRLELIAKDHNLPDLKPLGPRSYAIQWLDSAHGDDMGNFTIEELQQEFTEWLNEDY